MLATDRLGLCLLFKSDATDFKADEHLASSGGLIQNFTHLSHL